MTSEIKYQISERFRIAKGLFWEAKPAWKLIIFCALMILFFIIFPSERLGFRPSMADRIRWLGMFFQLWGVIAVIRGIDHSRRMFGKQPILAEAISWLFRIRFLIVLPRRKAQHITLATATGVFATAGAGVVRGVSQSSIEDRVNFLEQENKRAFSAIEEADKKIGALETKATQLIEEERKARQAAEEKLGKRLEETKIGGVALELAGVFYLMIGIILSSIPEEVAACLHRVGLGVLEIDPIFLFT